MKTQPGDQKMITTWMKDIENCIALSGEACNSVKEIATVYGKAASKS